MIYQALLFGDDDEAERLELDRILALEQRQLYEEARKLAWYQGQPYPEDQAKWSATHRDIVNARCREAYSDSYPAVAEYYLSSAARTRAERNGAKLGRRGPILDIYRRAVHEPVIVCYWCKKLTGPGERHVDHIKALAAGGTHTAGNLCIACEDCNLSKGDASPDDFRVRIAGRRTQNAFLAADYFRSRARNRNQPRVPQ